MNLIKLMPVTAIIMLAGIITFFFRQALGALSSLLGAIMALAILSFLGWFVIDYTN